MTKTLTDRSPHLADIRKLFSSQNLAVLSTQKSGHPYASLVAFSFSPDLGCLYFLTREKTRKFENLLACDRVALLVHSAANQTGDFSNAVSVTVLGRALPTAPEDKIIQPFLQRHPELTAFSQDPETRVLEVTVESYVLVSRFEEVITINMEK